MPKSDFKGKFRRAKARGPNGTDVLAGSFLLSAGGVVVGIPLAFFDGGLTLMSSGAALGAIIVGAPSDLKLAKDMGYEGYFEFDGQKYYLEERQFMKLYKLQGQISRLHAKFNGAATNKRRRHLQKEIQKRIDHQIDILKSSNVSTEKPEEKPPEELIDLKVNKSFTQRNMGN